MRGKIDLAGHKMAGLYVAPARKTRWKRNVMQKCPDDAYRQIWRLVDGAVRDAFSCHPEFLTDRGRRNAAGSVTKRVTGTLHGYATQVARGRSETVVSYSTGEAAELTDARLYGVGQPALSIRRSEATSWKGRLWQWLLGRCPKFIGGAR